MNKERFEKLISFISEELTDTCPRADIDVNEEELPWCCEEYCMDYGGAECWKKWVMGETE